LVASAKVYGIGKGYREKKELRIFIDLLEPPSATRSGKKKGEADETGLQRPILRIGEGVASIIGDPDAECALERRLEGKKRRFAIPHRLAASGKKGVAER